MNYRGVIVEESLGDKTVLNGVKILNTRIKKVTRKHKTPWLKQWTLHAVEISPDKAQEIARKISKSFDRKHPDWYADYKNDKYHFIIYTEKIFKIDLTNPVLYREAKDYGMSLGIPEYQVDFAPGDKIWEK